VEERIFEMKVAAVLKQQAKDLFLWFEELDAVEVGGREAPAPTGEAA
jgi:hypothetical protein